MVGRGLGLGRGRGATLPALLKSHALDLCRFSPALQAPAAFRPPVWQRLQQQQPLTSTLPFVPLAAAAAAEGGGGGGGGRGRGLGRSSEASDIISVVGRDVPERGRGRLQQEWWRAGAVAPSILLARGGDRNFAGMTMAANVAAAGCGMGASLSSMCLAAGPRSTRSALRRSFDCSPLLLSAAGGRSLVTEAGKVVGLARGRSSSVEGEVGFSRSKVGKLCRDRPSVLVGASVSASSSSASSVPGISYTEPLIDEGDGGNGFSGGRGGGGGGGGGGGDNGHGGSESSGAGQGGSSIGGGGFLSAFLNGWRSRVQADPQFPFKVLTEEVIGVGACVLGDMASRPNFGLDELDLVFSTIVVGSILNFTLMYMLAPTAAMGAVASKLPGIFANSPTGHMFEVGAYSMKDRFGTFVYKGTQFAAVGFLAGLVGTFLSTTLLNARKKMDPDFVIQNASPPTLLNAATWALHMGISSNARYQSINGLEFAMAKALPAGVFKTLVFVIRGLNNVVGGTSFVILARLTGSQPREGTPVPKETAAEDSALEHAKTS